MGKVLKEVSLTDDIRGINYAVVWCQLDWRGERQEELTLTVVSAKTPQQALEEVLEEEDSGRLDMHYDATVYPVKITFDEPVLTVNDRIQRGTD